jgi:hypothetical protein
VSSRRHNLKKQVHTNTNMYKRPTIRKHTYCSKFVSEIRPNGACVSSWVRCDAPPVIWTGQEGRVGDIVSSMHRGSDCVARPEKSDWRPPYDYEFIAKHMSDPDEYIAKCKAWFEANVPPPRTVRTKVEYDRELVQALFQKYPGSVPPFDERVKVYRAAGKPEAYIERVIVRHERFLATADEQQKVIDTLFGKWPSAKKAVKQPPKVIKAVKKKMV